MEKKKELKRHTFVPFKKILSPLIKIFYIAMVFHQTLHAPLARKNWPGVENDEAFDYSKCPRKPRNATHMLKDQACLKENENLNGVQFAERHVFKICNDEKAIQFAEFLKDFEIPDEFKQSGDDSSAETQIKHTRATYARILNTAMSAKEACRHLAKKTIKSCPILALMYDEAKGSGPCRDGKFPKAVPAGRKMLREEPVSRIEHAEMFEEYLSNNVNIRPQLATKLAKAFESQKVVDFFQVRRAAEIFAKNFSMTIEVALTKVLERDINNLDLDQAERFFPYMNMLQLPLDLDILLKYQTLNFDQVDRMLPYAKKMIASSGPVMLPNMPMLKFFNQLRLSPIARLSFDTMYYVYFYTPMRLAQKTISLGAQAANTVVDFNDVLNLSQNFADKLDVVENLHKLSEKDPSQEELWHYMGSIAHSCPKSIVYANLLNFDKFKVASQISEKTAAAASLDWKYQDLDFAKVAFISDAMKLLFDHQWTEVLIMLSDANKTSFLGQQMVEAQSTSPHRYEKGVADMCIRIALSPLWQAYDIDRIRTVNEFLAKGAGGKSKDLVYAMTQALQPWIQAANFEDISKILKECQNVNNRKNCWSLKTVDVEANANVGEQANAWLAEALAGFINGTKYVYC
jgi:hypothetical protein